MPDEIVKKEIFWLGHTVSDATDEACGNCVEQQTFLDGIKDKVPNLEVKHGDIYAPEHQSLVEEKKIKHMPWTEVCTTKRSDDGQEKKDCKTISGFDKKKLEKLIK